MEFASWEKSACFVFVTTYCSESLCLEFCISKIPRTAYQDFIFVSISPSRSSFFSIDKLHR